MILRVPLLAGLMCACAVAAEPDFRPIFDGHSLTGWDGDSRYWSVRAGAIRGETTLKDLPKSNTFLIWRGGVLKDFELKLKFRIQNGNSGIQYRSRDLGKWVMAGYQAEIENSQGKVGFLYEERGRKFLARVGESVVAGADGRTRVSGLLGDRKKDFIDRGYYKEKEWNEYRIVGRGPHLEQWLNGTKTIELNDEDPARRSLEGLLGFQIHAGPPMVVEFRDILLRSQ